MDEKTILTILVVIISADFILQGILSYLNRESAKKKIPETLEGIYDEEKYRTSQKYNSEIARFGSISSTVSFVLLLAALLFGWFGLLDHWIRAFSPLSLTTPLIFFGILYLASDLLGTPFSIYRTFVIEEKYGFNKMTPKTYVADKLKGYLLTLIFGALILGTLVFLVDSIGRNFWIYFWIILALFSLGANVLYTSLILPLFNKLTPIEEGELKDSIKTYSQKVNFPLTNIFIMDGSKRSSKGNAFFSGLGKRKKVVLFDTLIEKHSTEELTAVFAHEVGHFKKKHIVSGTIFGILLMGVMLFLFSRMAYSAEVSWAMGGDTSALHLNLLAFGILYTPLSTIFGIIGNVISRKNEYEADNYAKSTYNAAPLVQGLKKMSSDHLSNLTPHPAYVFVHYSHPPLLERIQNLLK